MPDTTTFRSPTTVLITTSAQHPSLINPQSASGHLADRIFDLQDMPLRSAAVIAVAFAVSANRFVIRERVKITAYFEFFIL